MLAVILALGASLAFGASNFIAGLESRRRSVWTVTAVSQIASALSAGVFLVFAHDALLTASAAIWSIVAGVAAAGGVLALYRALALGAMSVVSPIIALQVVIPVAAGLLMGDRPSALEYVAMAVAAGGVVLVSRTKANRGTHAPAAAIALAVLTAVLFGIMLLGLDQAGDGAVYSAAFVVRVASAVVVLAYFLATRRRFDMSAKAWPNLTLAGVLLTAATMLFIGAANIGLLSVVSVLGSLSPVVTTALAQVLLKERLGPWQWVGAGSVLAAVVMLSV